MGIILDREKLGYILESEPKGFISRLESRKGEMGCRFLASGLKIWWMVMPCTEMSRSRLEREAKKPSLGMLFRDA